MARLSVLLKHRCEPIFVFAFEGVLFVFAFTRPAFELSFALPPKITPLAQSRHVIFVSLPRYASKKQRREPINATAFEGA